MPSLGSWQTYIVSLTFSGGIFSLQVAKRGKPAGIHARDRNGAAQHADFSEPPKINTASQNSPRTLVSSPAAGSSQYRVFQTGYIGPYRHLAYNCTASPRG
jgi:hypothetical protein